MCKRKFRDVFYEKISTGKGSLQHCKNTCKCQSKGVSANGIQSGEKDCNFQYSQIIFAYSPKKKKKLCFFQNFFGEMKIILLCNQKKKK